MTTPTNSQQPPTTQSAAFNMPASDAIDLMPLAQSNDKNTLSQSPSRVSNTLESQMQINLDPS